MGVDPRPGNEGSQFDPLGLREDPLQSDARATPAVFAVDSMAQPQLNLPNEIGVLLVRLTMASLMVHHGLDKLQNAEGFSANVVAKYFDYLPGEPIWWTYIAAVTQIVTPAGLLGRLSAFGLFCTMAFATVFHFQATGLEGFPLAVELQPAVFTVDPRPGNEGSQFDPLGLREDPLQSDARATPAVFAVDSMA